MIKIGFDKNPNTDFILDIRDKNQVIKAQYAIGADDLYKFLLMQEHHIEISFNWNSYIRFKRSDYIVYEGIKFTLRENYKPTLEDGKYRYELQFDAPEILFKDIDFYYMNQNLKEGSWKITTSATRVMQIGVDNINRYFGTTLYHLGTIEPETIEFMEFDINTKVFDAFTQIAEKFKAEWNLQGYTLNLVKKFSYGAEVDFQIGTSVEKMDRSEGEDSEVYTRLLALGSTRNLPANYRETTSGEAVDAIYQKRLRIPLDKGDVIDAYEDMSPEEAIEGTVVFEEVYPRRIGTMSDVTTVEYSETNEDTGETKKWNAFRYKDVGLQFKEEYVLPGEELRIHIESGDCNGFDLAVKFNPDGYPETDSRSQVFEIYRTEDYGNPTPNDILHPKDGDTYVLYGFNIDLVSDQYVPEAEQELYETAVGWQKGRLKDKSVFECPTIAKYFLDNSMDLEIGQKVRLVHESFEDGYRSSRIQGFEKHLINKYKAIYKVGDNPTYSWGKEIVDSIKELQISGKTYQAVGGNGVYLIKQFDQVRPTDFNAYSAKASDAKYFNKQTGGTVQGATAFQQGVSISGKTMTDDIQSLSHSAGQLGHGFRLWIENGLSYGQLDYLTVTREFLINTLTIAETKSVGGQIILSLANMVCESVVDGGTYWQCKFNNDNGSIPNNFAVNDQVICRKFNGTAAKYYWARVTSVGDNYINISKTDKDGSGIPSVGDEVIQLGHRTDANRQHAILISAYGSDAPSINQYAGINSYDLTGKEVTAISPKGNKFTGSFTVSTNGTTAPVYKERAAFVNGTVYYLNDRVSYLGSYWVCIVNTTVTSPSEGSSTWRKDTVGQKDIDKVEVIANNAQDEAEKVRNEYKADFVILDTKIASKVSQTDFNALGGRVSTAESNITQLSGSITSVVETVNDISFGGRNYLLASSSAKTIIGQGINNQTAFGYRFVGGTLEKANLLNKDVTLSCKYKVEGLDKDVRLSFSGYDPYPFFGFITLSPANTEGKFISTTKHSSAYAASPWINIRVDNLPSYATLVISEMKLEVGNKATDWSEAPEDTEARIKQAQEKANQAQSTADQAQADAANAQSAASKAQTDANTANNLLADIANDDKLTPNEKQETKKEWDGIVSEYSKNIAQANKFGISTTTYTNTYNALNSYTTPLLSNLGTTSSISGTTFRATFKAYYDARIDLLNAISTKAKELADAAQTSADNAQNTANLKNRTYYQDEVPTVPSGGHKVGDLWHKESLVDSSGNINADTSKNIYQLQYRWDGTIWKQINWSVARSKIEQTDSSIGLLVEKTGINSVGAGSSLFSMIQLVPDQIKLEVSKVQVGGRNYLRSTSTPRTIIGKNTSNQVTSGYNFVNGSLEKAGLLEKDVTLSFKYKVEGLDKTVWLNIIGDDPYPHFGSISLTAANNQGIFSQTKKISATYGASTKINIRVDNMPTYATVVISEMQLEIGNKATDWSEAREDTQNAINKAQQTADAAQTNATNANNLLSDISNDNKFTPSEKSETKKEWDAIQSEYTKNINQATSFSIPSTAYTSAYNALNSYISPLLSNLSTTSDIVGTTFRSRFKAYYDARTDLLNAISTKAKEIADSKTTINEVKAGIKINADGITAFGDTFKVDSTLIANAIETDELSVGDGNFRVGTDGKINAKGANIEGSLKLSWNGSSSSSADTMSVVDSSTGVDKTKVLITPQNVRDLSNIAGNTTESLINTTAVFNTISNNSYTWNSSTFTLPEGKTYDVEIPVIYLTASTTVDNPLLHSAWARYSLYLKNITTGAIYHIDSAAVGVIGTTDYASSDKVYTSTGRQAGVYQIEVVIEAYSGSSGTGEASIGVPANSKVKIKPIVDAIEIGANGLMGSFTSSSYFHLTTGGFHLRMENTGFKVTSDGVYVSDNINAATPTWRKI